MTSDDQPIKVYEGELADVVFLRSLMAEARIEVVSAGVFFGPAKEIHVKRRDAAQAQEIIADFDSQQTKRKRDVLRGPW